MNKNENLEIARVHEKVTLRKEKFAKKMNRSKKICTNISTSNFSGQIKSDMIITGACKIIRPILNFATGNTVKTHFYSSQF